MLKQLGTVLLALSLATGAVAAEKKRIEKAADLPRFSYQINGKLEDLVRDDARFREFAAQVRHDDESVLAQYDIADKAAQRQILSVLAQLDFLEGQYEAADKRAFEIRSLEEKPADKVLSGLQLRSMVAARLEVGNIDSPEYRAAVGRLITAELAKLPYPLIENDIKGAKTSAEVLGESLVLGNVRDVLQPVVDKAGGTISSELAPGIVGARYALIARLPLKQTLIDTFTAYLAANKQEKPDIWAARSVDLPPGKSYALVRIAVWDSGVDSSLFKGRVVQEGGKDAYIAYDRYSNPANGELAPIPADLQNRIPSMEARIKGLSDLQSNVDSPEASQVKELLSTLKRDEYKRVIEELDLAGNYVHGTHVAGIAMAGNPYARLVIARIEYDYHLLPDPCPSRELAEKGAKAYKATVDFMKREGVRVANMSWGGDVAGYEHQLELCGIGKTPEERKKIAREYFEIDKKGLTEAMASAPGILFVTAAGNSNENASFAEDIPAGIVLPNLLAVGAVDKAGDEAPFTSYGPTVKVHANGYQVESYFPGGEKVALSGTSMASPQVANLAAKILAANSTLKPPQVIDIIVKTAEKTSDGRRVLIDPAKAVAAAERHAR
ncbi:MAG TPA: S8 family serine peptidase [Anaeromyxobacteraceae bacterium]|nr:S8 family serine peptidase [Anaeromyxobacteraceae bacterium]